MVMRLLKGDGKKGKSEDPMLRKIKEEGIFGQDINDVKNVPLPKPAAPAPVQAQQLPQNERQAIIDAAESVFESVNAKTSGWSGKQNFIEWGPSEFQKLSDALKILEKHGNAKSAHYLSGYLDMNIMRLVVPTLSFNPWSQNNKVRKMQERTRKNIAQAVEEIALREPNEFQSLLTGTSWSVISPLLYVIVWENFDKFKALPSYPDFAKKVLSDCSHISSMNSIMQEIHIRLQKKIAGVD